MARTSQRVNYNTFQGGKYSDSNPVNPPENAVRTLLNVDVALNGKIGRRLGLEPETNFNLPVDINNNDPDTWLSGYSLDDIAQSGIDIYEWKNVDNQSGINYRVVRIRNDLYIYDEGGDALSDSLVRVVDISAYATVNANTSAEEDFQAASGRGLLLCSGSQYKPFYVKYDADTDAWTDAEIEIEIRDFEGVDDGLEIDEKPATLSAEHLYNLRNQGWPVTMECFADLAGNNTNIEDPVSFIFNITGKYPSNADIVYLGKADAAEDPKSIGALSTTTFNKGLFGNTKAPQGHFIINPFDDNGRLDASGIDVDTEGANGRPKAVAFFAGRVWYAAVNGTLFYSKIIESVEDLGKCYQEQDPTAEQLNELLDTDGGTLKILDIGSVEKMVPIGTSLVIIGTNGVWAVSGGDTGFTANNQVIDHVSKIKVTNYRAVVAAEDAVYMFAEEGIYAVHKNELGSLVATSLTENRMQGDYNAIPASAKSVAQAMYDRVQRKVYWCYSHHTTDFSTDVKHKYTDVLIYSIPLNAFWDYRLTNEGFTQASDSYPIMCGMFPPSFRADGEVQENVTLFGGGVVLANDTTAAHRIPGYVTDINEDIVSATTYSTVNLETPVFIQETVPYIVSTVNASNSIYRTSDGDTWELVNSNFAGGGVSTTSWTHCKDTAYSPTLNILVRFHSTNGPQWSTDLGDNWTNMNWSTDDDFYFATRTFGKFVFWDTVRNMFVALPSESDVASTTDASYSVVTSVNGKDWVGVVGSDIHALGNDNVNSAVFLPTYGTQGRYVVVTGANEIYYTDNLGVSWTAASGDTGAGSPDWLTYNAVDDVIFSSTTTTTRYISTDGGATWTSASITGYTNRLNKCEYSEQFSVYLAPEPNGGFRYSTDGIDFSSVIDGINSTTYHYYLDAPVYESIVTDSSENVTVGVQVTQFSDVNIKVAMLVPDSSGDLRLTFGQFSSRAFEDWDTMDSTSLMANTNYTASFPVAAMGSGDYSSVVETLPQTLGEPSLMKSAPYLHTYFDYVRGGYNDFETPDEFDSA